MSKHLFFETRQAELALLVEQAESGDIASLALYAECKELEGMFKKVVAQLEPLAFMEAETYVEKTFMFEGFEFEKRNGATRYNYKGIAEWQILNAQLKAVEERARQAFLARQKNILVASEEGEEIELPEVVYSKSSLLAKKAKQYA
jgi:hypothetical protein